MRAPRSRPEGPEQRLRRLRARLRTLLRALRQGPGAWPAAAGLVFCAVALWALAGNVIVPHFGFSRYRMGWALTVAAVVLLLSALLWVLLDRGMAADRTRPPAAGHRPWKIAAGILFWAALCVVQLRVTYAVRLPPDWDAYPIHESAAGLADGSLSQLGRYFRINPNNLLLTLLLAAYDRWVLDLGFTDLHMAAAFLNGVLLFAATVLTYSAARLLGGPGAAALTVLPATVFLTFSPWAGVLYSDTAGTFLTVLILYLLLLSCRTRRKYLRAVLWIAAGGVGAIGMGIKPTVAICLLAAGITAVCLLARRQHTAVLLAAVAVVGGSFLLGNRLIDGFMQQAPVVGFDTSNSPDAMNPGHFLKVGAQVSEGPNGPYYGSYNQADYEQTLALSGADRKLHAGVDAYFERVERMGPAGYLQFLDNKLLWVTGDGSFFAWGEGRLTGNDFLSQEPADKGLQDLIGNTGPHFPWMLSIWQGTWFAVLALAAVPLLLRTPFLLRPELSAMRITLLGLLLFLLFFEGRARFLYLYTPYFTILAALSFQAVMERLRHGRQHPQSAGAVRSCRSD